nr:hypothetical protein [Desulforhopalus sp. IMCC35007]
MNDETMSFDTNVIRGRRTPLMKFPTSDNTFTPKSAVFRLRKYE